MKPTAVLIVTVFLTVASRCFAIDSSKCNSYPCLIFEDNFDYFNFDTWEHEISAYGGGNSEFQFYFNNRSNSYIKDGAMHIRPTLAEETFGKNWEYNGKLDLWGTQPADVCTGNAWSGCARRAMTGGNVAPPIQSARIRTSNSFSFRYGRIEVEAKMPKGDWLWPAIWMFPRLQKYGIWPTSGEIDVVESRGNAEIYDILGDPIGTSAMWVAVHFGPTRAENTFLPTLTYKALKNGKTFADDFHKFRVDWDEHGFKFYVDGELLRFHVTGDGYWKFGGWASRWGPETNPWATGNKDAPFDQEYYIVMNVAVGGTIGYFGEEWTIHPPYPKPWKDNSTVAMREFWEKKHLWYPTWPNDDSRAMRVNYVKVWKLKPDCWLTKPPTCSP